MGMILPPRRVSADSSGNGRNGAKLRIYNANTTTLASVYSDAALSTPLTNPVVANSSGVFPPIYAAEAAYDITEQTSAGATIYSEDDVPSISISSGVLTRDFTNSRARIAGSGGVVSYEGGDPTGDDVGGNVRLGGYNDTQATTAEIDAAATTVTGTMAVTGAVTTSSTLATGGIITENSKKLIGIVATNATAFTSVSSVDITLPDTPTTLAWEIELFGVTMSAQAAVRGRLGYSGAVKTGASDYSYGTQNFFVTPAQAADDAEAYMQLMAAADHGFDMTIKLRTVASGSGYTVLRGNGYDYRGTPASEVMHVFAAQGMGGYGKATTLQIYLSTGTMSGSYRVVQLRGYGE